LIEVHVSPADALSDAEQALAPDEFTALMQSLEPVAAAVGRTLQVPALEEIGR
jgi:3-deoxy-7-phosphoheptulonate synthase